MTSKTRDSSTKPVSGQTMPAEAPSFSPGEGKQTISPAERWLRIRENAYARAQKRGFVGGNPFTDWVEAEKEIDTKYATDYQGVFSLTDPAEVTRQIENLLADHGSGHLSVDALLDQYQNSMDRVSAFNRAVMESTSELANQQTTLVQDALNEAVHTLQTVAHGKVDTDGVAKQAQLSIKAIENALAHLTTLTEAMTGITLGARKDTSTDS